MSSLNRYQILILYTHPASTAYRLVEPYDRFPNTRGPWPAWPLFRRSSFVRSKFVVSALCGATLISGCYVIPLDYPQAPSQALAVTSPGASAVAVPAPHPVPTILQARLYPINEMAGKMGALTATVNDRLNGHATFSLSHGGEVLQGEASRVPAGYPGFGRVHREVYGDGRMPAGQRGIASAVGAGGTYVNCEYALSAPKRGMGACVFSNGAKYQLHFGG